VAAQKRLGGGSPVTAAGPCRIHTGFPILPAHRRGTSQHFVPPRTVHGRARQVV